MSKRPQDINYKKITPEAIQKYTGSILRGQETQEQKERNKRTTHQPQKNQVSWENILKAFIK